MNDNETETKAWGRFDCDDCGIDVDDIYESKLGGFYCADCIDDNGGLLDG